MANTEDGRLGRICLGDHRQFEIVSTNRHSSEATIHSVVRHDVMKVVSHDVMKVVLLIELDENLV